MWRMGAALRLAGVIAEAREREAEAEAGGILLRRVCPLDKALKDGGLLIAPNFVSHQSGIISCLWSGILRIAGITFEHQWSGEEYLSWLGQNGWKVQYKKSCPARITLMYVECIRE